MKPILEIQNISKKFRIRHENEPYLSLREVLVNIFYNDKATREVFYALKNIELNIERGQSIGIIGKNGAGKSTLLKILSRITPPTSGKIIARGRVASLLEVGTGFHPELSGRENIFLNGSILGMSKHEIKKNFDDIVDFSGVEKFLDTPLKHYSSGMQLRLAFAVAAFLENEILVIDEVLAVGDAEFQKKCIKKMEDVSQNQGRTVLFVSHNMNAINTLCEKCVYLKSGEVVQFDNTDIVVNNYLSNESSIILEKDFIEGYIGDESVRLISARIINDNNKKPKSIFIHQDIGVEIIYEVLNNDKKPIPNIHVFNSMGEYAFVSSDNYYDSLSAKGIHRSIVWIPKNLLNEGYYAIGIALSTYSPLKVHFFIKDALSFDVYEDINLRNFDYVHKLPGVIRPKLKWENYLIEKI